MAILKAAPNMALGADGANIAGVDTGGPSMYFSSMSPGGDSAGGKYRNSVLLAGQTRLWQFAGTNFRFGIVNLASHTRHRQRFTIRKPAAPPSGTTLTWLEVELGDNSAAAFQLQWNSANLMRARDQFTTRETFDMTSRINQLIDVEIDLDGAGDLHAYLYSGADRASTDHGDAFVELNGVLTATNFGQLRLGKLATVTGGDTIEILYVSEITTSETPTPYTEPAPPEESDDVGTMQLMKVVDGELVEQELLVCHDDSDPTDIANWTYLALDKIGLVIPDPEDPDDGEISKFLVPRDKCWWAAETPNQGSRGATLSGLQNYETQVRTPDGLHFYTQPWDGRISSTQAAQRTRPGKPQPWILQSTKLLAGATWEDIANGQYDSYIDSMAAGLRQRTDRHFVKFWHEPEDDVTSGEWQAADYVAAWNHFRTRLESQGVAHVEDGGKSIFVLCYMGYRGHGQALFESLVPASTSFDWFGWDPYASDNDYYANPHKWLNDSEGSWPGMYAWAMSHPVLSTKPFMICEWGVNHASTGDGFVSEAEEAAWVNQLAGILQADFPNIKALVHWPGDYTDGNGWNMQLYNRTTAQAAYRSQANNPYFKPRLDLIPA